MELDKQATQGEKLVMGIANRFISNDYIEDAVAVFQRHLSKLEDDELEAMSQKEINLWFKEYAEKKPALARKPGERRKVIEPAKTGGDPQKKPDPSKAPIQGKTPRPNQPNSMTRAEFEAYKRSKGIDY